jgi:hypothetical protein
VLRNLLALPDDVLIRISQNVDVSTIRKLRLTCKALKCTGSACISGLVLADPYSTTIKPQLEASLQSLKGLTSLSLCIATKDQLLLLETDGVMRVLTGLDVNVASLRTSGCRAIIPRLGRASNLHSLCLSANKAPLTIGLARYLSICSGLRRLSVIDADMGFQEAKAVLTAMHLTALEVRTRRHWRWRLQYRPSRSWEFWDALGTGLSQLTGLVELGTVPETHGPFFPSQLTGLRALKCIMYGEGLVAINALRTMSWISNLEFNPGQPEWMRIGASLYGSLLQFLTGLTRLCLAANSDNNFSLNLLPTGLQQLQIHFSWSMARAIEPFPTITSLQHLEVGSAKCFPNLVSCIGPLTGLTDLGIRGKPCWAYLGDRCSRCIPLSPNWRDLACLPGMTGLRSLNLELDKLCHEQNLQYLQVLTGITKQEARDGREVKPCVLETLKPQLLETLQDIEEVDLGRFPMCFQTQLNGLRRALGLNPVLEG